MFELIGTWAMVLLAGVVLGGVAVLVPIGVVFSLRAVETAITGSRHALNACLRRLGRPSAGTGRARGGIGRRLTAEGRKEP